jgi:hypothetical protein
VGWCNKCWCNKGYQIPPIHFIDGGSRDSNEDFFRRKIDLLEDQIMVWAEEFHVHRFEVYLQDRDGGSGLSSKKTIVDPAAAKRHVLDWRREWERSGEITNIKIRPG